MQIFLAVLLLWGFTSFARMPSFPEGDSDFLILPDESQLSDITVNGAPLSLTRGTGEDFGINQQCKYAVLKAATLLAPDHPVQWTLMNLDTHQILQQSRNAQRRIYGASVAKIFTAGALLNKQAGGLSSSKQKQLMADMLVISSNSAWMELQRQIGDGDANLGRQRTQEFTDALGYKNTRPYAGYWDDRHGNELNAQELAEYLYDTYRAHYPGAEYVWKLLYTSRAGDPGAMLYFPQNLFIGGKAGVYDGPTSNPDTGSSTNPDGSNYTVAVRNHIIVFHKDGHEYALTILANTGTFEDAELLAGGLFREIQLALNRPTWRASGF